MCTVSPRFCEDPCKATGRNGKGKWHFLVLLASVTVSCQTSLLLLPSSWDTRLMPVVWEAQRWSSTSGKTGPYAGQLLVFDVTQVPAVPLACSLVDLHKLWVCIRGLHTPQPRQIEKNLQILSVNPPATKVIQTSEVHFGTKVLQSYKSLQFSWTNNLVFGEA